MRKGGLLVMLQGVWADGCFKLKGSLTCPDWSRFEIKTGFNFTHPLFSTGVVRTTRVTEFDSLIYSMLDSAIQPTSPDKLIDDKACGPARSAVSQMTQPLLCASSISDVSNSRCDRHPPPVCRHACLRQVGAILELLEANPACFANSTGSNFYESRATLVTTCGRPNMKGEKGDCLLLNSQADTLINFGLGSRVVIAIAASGGGVLVLLALGLTIYFVRRRKPTIEEKHPVNPELHTQLLVAHFPFFARREDEIHLNRMDEVVLIKQFDDGWALGKNCRTGDQGKFPLVCLNTGCPMQPITLNKLDNTYRVIPKRSSSTLSLNLISSNPSHPAPSNEGPLESLGMDITPTTSYRPKPFPKFRDPAKHLQTTNTSSNSSNSDVSQIPTTPPPPSHSPPKPQLPLDD